jgi:hypothetical protein
LRRALMQELRHWEQTDAAITASDLVEDEKA